MDKRHYWFHEGARFYQQAAVKFGRTDQHDGGDDMYLCPLCLRSFPLAAIASGELTIEHVPPESLGGKGLLLTCARCNHMSGTAFDAAASNAERLRSHLAGTYDGSIAATFALNEAPVNGEMRIAGAGQLSLSDDFEISVEAESGVGLYFNTVSKINSPANIALFDDSWHHAPGKRFTISYTIRSKAPLDRANASWIRAAYLAAFSRFGWFFALQPFFETLRDQLQRGKGVKLPQLYRYYEDVDPHRRELLVVTEDPNFECLVVIFGQHIVFFPLVGSTMSLDELAAAIVRVESSGGTLTLTGFAEPWPDVPQYAYDRALEEWDVARTRPA